MRVLKIYIEWPTGGRTDEVEIDDAEWEAMTPKERDDFIEGEAEVAFNNACSYGFVVEEVAE